MRVKTSADEVELTAGMVRPGMVFQSEHWRCADAPDGAMTMARPSDVWCGDEQGWTSTTGCGVIASTGRLLGCDPAVAAREDVERYGVAPGIDAAEHGFARLRDGGSVYLWGDNQLPIGAVVEDDDGSRRVVLPSILSARWLQPGERFIGLDTRHARPEDVTRLCCGAEHTYRVGERAMGRDVCTLAIGDHEEHEDIATGTRWAAKSGSAEVAAWRARSEATGSDDALRARLREEERARQIARARVGEPEPGTIAWITALVKEDGYGCYVERARRGPGTVDVTVFGASVAYCAGLQCRLRDNMPGYVDVLVERTDAPPDNGRQLDALVAACDMRRGFGETDESLWARFEAYVREELARVSREHTSARHSIGVDMAEGPDRTAFTLFEHGTHRAVGLDDIDRMPGEYSWQAARARWVASRRREGRSVCRLASVAGMAGARPQDNGFRFEAQSTTALPGAPAAPGDPQDAEAERKAARALAKALRSALPSVDALSWSAAERKALRAAAHAVCEACEAACERSVPYGVTWGATEMVAALATAAEMGPDAIGRAEKIAARVVGYMKGRCA